MRTPVRAVATLVATAPLVVAFGSPAGALTSCPKGEPICVYVPAGSYPVGNPVTSGPYSQPITPVQLPSVCDSNGNNCLETWLILPGYYANSTGGSLATVHFPGAGVGVDNSGHATIYASGPTYTTGGSLGVTVTVAADTLPVASNSVTRECEQLRPIGVGPVSVTGSSCVVFTTVSV